MNITEKSVLDALLTGTTHVFAIGSDEAFVYYETADRAHMRLPDGTIKHGAWAITSTGYHVDWEGGPSADWQITKHNGQLSYLNGEGVVIGIITRIVPGDEQKIAAE